jgi:hypothetical protein
MMLSGHEIEARPGPDDEVIGMWSKAVATIRDSMHADISADAVFTLSYQAALQAATVVVRAAGYRVRGGAHHQHTFEAVIALEGGPDLTAAARDLNALRKKRHTAVYEWERRIEQKDLDAMRSAAERLFAGAHRWLISQRPHLAASLPNP